MGKTPKKRKLAVCVGHTKNDQGATSFKGVSEYIWNGQVAKFMEELAKALPDFEVKVFWRDGGGVAAAARAAKAWGADSWIELHFNAASGKAEGCECLVLKGDVPSAKHADLLTDLLAAQYGFTERRITRILPDEFDGDGVYEVVSGNNGYGNLLAVKNAGIPIRMLIEPNFLHIASNEAKKIHDDQRGYAKLMVNHFAGLAPEYATDTPEATMEEFVQALNVHEFKDAKELNKVKDVILAQMILETGRGGSELFKLWKNPLGMKARSEIKTPGWKPVSYNAHDGRDHYASFESFKASLEYYEAFILRSPYKGFQDVITNLGSLGFLKHIKAAGYAESPLYVEKVSALFEEARGHLTGSNSEVMEIIDSMRASLDKLEKILKA